MCRYRTYYILTLPFHCLALQAAYDLVRYTRFAFRKVLNPNCPVIEVITTQGRYFCCKRDAIHLFVERSRQAQPWCEYIKENLIIKQELIY